MFIWDILFGILYTCPLKIVCTYCNCEPFALLFSIRLMLGGNDGGSCSKEDGECLQEAEGKASEIGHFHEKLSPTHFSTRWSLHLGWSCSRPLPPSGNILAASNPISIAPKTNTGSNLKVRLVDFNGTATVYQDRLGFFIVHQIMTGYFSTSKVLKTYLGCLSSICVKQTIWLLCVS